MTDQKITLDIAGDNSDSNRKLDETISKLGSLGQAAETAGQRGRVGMSSWEQSLAGASNAQKRTSEETARMRDELDKLIGKIDKTAGAYSKFDSQLAQLQMFKKKGLLSDDDFNAYAAGIEKARKAAGVLANGLHIISLNSSFARLEMVRLFKDAATGQTQNFIRTFGTLAAQTGILSRVFTGMGPAVLGAVGAIATFAAAVVQGSLEIDRFNKSISVSGNVVGMNADQMRSLADSIGSASGSFSLADEALNKLTMSGRLSGQALADAGAAAVAMSDLTGQSVDKIVTEMVKITKEPTKALVDLNDQFHFLTQAQYDTVRSLEKSGDAAGAAAVGFHALKEAMDERNTQAVDNAGYIERAWKSVGTAFSEDWRTFKQFMSDLGRNDLDSKMDAQLKKIMGMQNQLVSLKEETWAQAHPEVIAQAEKEIQLEEEKYRAMVKTNSAQTAATQAQAANNRAVSDGIDASQKVNKILEEHASKADKLKAAVADLSSTYEKLWKAQQAAYDKDPNAPMNPLLVGVTNGPNGFTGGAYSKALLDLQNEFKDTKKVVDDSQKDFDRLTLSIDQQMAAFSKGKTDTDRYKVSIADLTDAQRAFLSNKLDILDSWNEESKVVKAAGKGYDDLVKLGDSLAQKDEDIRLKTQNLDSAQSNYNDTLKKINAEYSAILQLGPPTVAQQQAYTDAIKNAHNVMEDTRGYDLQKRALQEQESAIKKAASMWDSLATSISKTLVDAFSKGGNVLKNLGQGLVNVMKDIVNQLIAQWLRTRIIGLFGNLFGGMGGLLGAGAQLAAAQTTGGGFAADGSIMGGSSFGGSSSIMTSVAGDLLGGNSSGSNGFSFSDPSSWIGAGQHLWNGFQTGFSTLWNGSATAGSSILGSWSGNGVSYVGGNGLTGGMGVNLPGGGAYTPSAFGTAAGIAGGLYAGYNEYNAAGGGAAGLLGGAAYGIGTVGAMGIAGSMMAGGGAAAGMAAGMGSIGLGAIPVVGWIALAAMAINMISGGKLFGTAAKPIGGDLTTTIGNSGADITNTLHEKGQKALFGGAYYKDKNLPVDQQSIDAVNTFFDSLKKGTADFAAQFGLTMSTIVGGTFTQKYDKKGKPTTTETVVNGVTYTGETSAQFQERLQADSYIAVLDKMGVAATKFTSGLQGDADALFKSVQDLAAASQAAYADINRGIGLLGPDGNLGAVMAEVEKLAGSGEALADAYKRLVTENDAWRGSMEAAALALNESSTKTLEFADSLAKAFGSASAMQQALATFDKSYYTPQELAANQLANDRAQLATQGAAIGQDPTETMAQFKQAFDAVEASLTPDQLAQWINFGNLLAQVTGEVNSAAQAAQTAANNYAQFMAQFTPAASGFEQAMQKVQVSLAQNIAQANALAVANGQAGASAQDIGTIISASVMQGVAAVQALEQEAAGLANTLFGSGDLQSQITALQTKLAADKAAFDNGSSMAGAFAQYDQQQLTQLQAQFATQQAAALKQQQFMQAAQLLGDLGQIGAITGQGLGDFSKMFSIPLDKFAAMLGTDKDHLGAQFDKQVEMARSAMETAQNTKYSAEIQANILAVLSGKNPTFSPDDIYAALTGTILAQQAAGGKGPGPIGATGPHATVSTNSATGTGASTSTSPTGTSSDPVVTKNPDTTTAVNNQTPILREIRDALRDNTMVRDRYYSPRNTRPSMV